MNIIEKEIKVVVFHEISFITTVKFHFDRIVIFGPEKIKVMIPIIVRDWLSNFIRARLAQFLITASIDVKSKSVIIDIGDGTYEIKYKLLKHKKEAKINSTYIYAYKFVFDENDLNNLNKALEEMSLLEEIRRAELEGVEESGFVEDSGVSSDVGSEMGAEAGEQNNE
ncbi:MAG: hypothetical protein JZD41_02100 [Thermoproteus sp.]|nr:hypothetical protein [Thermoproteus sp.]